MGKTRVLWWVLALWSTAAWGAGSSIQKELGHSQWQLRARAAHRAGVAGLKALKPQLLVALGDRYARVRGQAAWALGRLPGDEEVVRALIKLLQNEEDKSVDLHAINALARLGPKARPALSLLLDWLDWRKGQALLASLRAVARIAPGDLRVWEGLVSVLESGDEDARRVASQLLIGAGGKAAPVLKQALARVGKQSPWVLYVLAHWGEEAAALLKEMVGALHSKHKQTQIAAAMALGQLGAKAAPAVDALQKAAALPKRPLLRRYAVMALGNIGTPALASVASLVRLLEAESDAANTMALVVALGKLAKHSPQASQAVVGYFQRPGKRKMTLRRFHLDLEQLPHTSFKQPIEDTIARLPAAAIPSMLQALSTPYRYRKTIKRALAARGLSILAAVWQACRAPSLTGHAIDVLVAMGTKALPQLVKGIGDPRVRVRLCAATAWLSLSKKAPEARVLRVLGESLKQPEARTRLVALRALGRLQARAVPAIPGLIQALSDKHSEVRLRAARLLARLAPHSNAAVPALRRLLKAASVKVRIAALFALYELAPASAAWVPVVGEALKHRKLQIRSRGLLVLQELGPLALPLMPQLLPLIAHAKADIKERIARALGAMGPVAAPAAAALVRGLKQDIGVWNHGFHPAKHYTRERLNALLQMGPAIAAQIVPLLWEKHWSRRYMGLHILAQMGASAGHVAPHLFAALKDPAWQVRLEAGRALLRMGHGARLLAMLGASVRAPSTQHRMRALQLWYQLAQKERRFRTQAQAKLLAALADAHAHVRCEAASALGKLSQSSPKLLAALTQKLSDPSRDVKVCAAEALGRLAKPHPPALAPLRRLMASSHPNTRLSAAFALARIQSTQKDAFALLLNALQKPTPDPDSWWRRDLVEYLGLLAATHPKAIPPLIQVLLDKRGYFIRRHAAKALAQTLPKLSSRSPLRKKIIKGLCQALKWRFGDSYKIAARTLSQLGAPALPHLLALFKEKDQGTLLAVLQTLGRMGPKARPALPHVRKATAHPSWRIKAVAKWALRQIQP